jgi:hypothetical protein
MKLVTSLAFALLFGLGATTAYANCDQHACAEGSTWSQELGTCVPKPVSS